MKNGDSDCGVKMESEEEDDFEEIIDDDIEEAQVEANDGDTKAKNEKEGDFHGLGRSATMRTLEQPIVKFYFTAPCPELGLDKVIHSYCCIITTVETYILKASLAIPTIPQKKLNFLQICPKMPQNGPKITQNGPKWPKYDSKWPKMTRNGPKMTKNDPKWTNVAQI